MNRPWAIVPIKRFDRAKTRLSVLLDGAQRAALANAMVGDVLDVLVSVEALGGIAAVTNDPEAERLARSRGASIVPDLAEAGTNEAVRQGLAWLSLRGVAGAIVVPGDVPFICSSEVQTVAERMKESGVALVPAQRDGGTNLLAFTLSTMLRPAFGPESFARHLAAARALGIEPAILRFEGAGHDIDVPADLVPRAVCSATRTRAFLARMARHHPMPEMA